MKTLLIIFTIAISSLSLHAQNQIYIDVGQAKVKKSLLAFPAYQALGAESTSTTSKMGLELFNTSYNDLEVSGFFTFIKPSAFLENTEKIGLRPAPQYANGFDFKNWSTLGTEFLIRGGYKVIADKIHLEVYLYHVPQAKLVFAKNYSAPTSAIRKVAHTFSDDVIQALTGKKGSFNTKIVASVTKAGSKFKEIVVMDWDGVNTDYITNHKSIAISPAWSHDGKKIAYTAFAYHQSLKSRNADLFIFDVEERKRWLVSFRKGINSGAAFTPDGKSILLTISNSGSPDIYRMSTDGINISRITNGPNKAVNVEPAVNLRGDKIAFSSDRSGRPMIYTMDSGGGNIKRLTFAGKFNASPSWNPEGTKIAFAGFDNDHFDIFIINTDGTELKRLTDARKPNGKPATNEDPTFSPDGRLIMFVSDRTGRRQLYVTTPDGTTERRITYDNHDYDKPKWSPR